MQRPGLRRLAIGVGLALSTVAPATTARAEVDGNVFTSAQWRVRLTAPKGWLLNDRASYPSVLLWMSRRAPAGRLLLSAERLRANETVQAYATRTAARLTRLGFKVRPPQLHTATGAYWTEFDNGTAFLHQAFLVAGSVGYSLTLSASDARTRGQHLRALDSALRSLTVVRGAPTASEAPASPAPGPSLPPELGRGVRGVPEGAPAPNDGDPEPGREP